MRASQTHVSSPTEQLPAAIAGSEAGVPQQGKTIVIYAYAGCSEEPSTCEAIRPLMLDGLVVSYRFNVHVDDRLRPL